MSLIKVIFLLLLSMVEIEFVNASAVTIKDQCLSILKEALLQKVNQTDFNVHIESWNSAFSKLEAPSIKIEELDVDINGRRFTAQVNFDKHTQKINGRIEYLIEVPVLKRPMSGNDLIKKEDVVFQKMPVDKVSNSIIMSADELVGKSARTSAIKMNTPVQKSELQIPVVIKRGENVQLIYKSPHFMVTNMGSAKTDGCVGDNIAFEVVAQNNEGQSSRKMIQAKVVGPAQAEVMKIS